MSKNLCRSFKKLKTKDLDPTFKSNGLADVANTIKKLMTNGIQLVQFLELLSWIQRGQEVWFL